VLSMKPEKTIPSAEQMLQNFVVSYQKKIKPPFQGCLQIDLDETSQHWWIDFRENGEVSLAEGSAEDVFMTIKTSTETLRQLHDGDLSPVTAMGRAHYSDPAPLDIVPGKQASIAPGSRQFIEVLEFLQRFFNRSRPEKIQLGMEHSRSVHGGNVVGLFYGQGFRSAWYALKKGERLNDPDDVNPFPQALVFLSGSGKAQFGELTCTVKAGEAYHIPPGSAHVVWNEEEDPLELLFLAWGEGA
jgi:mannose-6-phosphate isomerase-like protein (cupin superfamily)